MNTRISHALILASLWIPASMAGQTYHALAPGTKGNKIELTVANTSSVPAESVVVRVTKSCLGLTFASTVKTIRSIQTGQEADALFDFSVSRSVQVNRRDTLEFSITDRSGFTWTKSIVVQYTGPATFALDQNFPNPFNPVTTIQYQLPTVSWVSMKVYDMLGREVATLASEARLAGYYDVRWDAANVASGVYFYRMEARPTNGGKSFQQIKKLMVVK